MSDERPQARRPRDDDDDDRDDRRPRKRRRDYEDSGDECPKCGSDDVESGPWPWYLGTIGAIVCKAMVCNECGHEWDLNKPDANLAARKRNLAIIINGIGLLGILAIVVGMYFYIKALNGP